MSWFKTFDRSDGGYDTFSWDLGDSAIVGFLTLLFGLLLLLFVVAIVPFYILFIYSFSIESHRRNQSLVGIVACNVWLADYHFGGVNFAIWGNTFPETFAILTVLNIIMLIIFLCLLIFDGVVFNIFRSTPSPMLISWVFFIWLLYMLYPLFNGLLNFIDVAETPFWL